MLIWIVSIPCTIHVRGLYTNVFVKRLFSCWMICFFFTCSLTASEVLYTIHMAIGLFRFALVGEWCEVLSERYICMHMCVSVCIVVCVLFGSSICALHQRTWNASHTKPYTHSHWWTSVALRYLKSILMICSAVRLSYFLLACSQLYQIYNNISLLVRVFVCAWLFLRWWLPLQLFAYKQPCNTCVFFSSIVHGLTQEPIHP